MKWTLISLIKRTKWGFLLALSNSPSPKNWRRFSTIIVNKFWVGSWKTQAKYGSSPKRVIMSPSSIKHLFPSSAKVHFTKEELSTTDSKSSYRIILDFSWVNKVFTKGASIMGRQTERGYSLKVNQRQHSRVSGKMDLSGVVLFKMK